ncbi:hypothetical protein RUM44_002881 [Polyplax serrata]|uniref:Uncharacterized protein n=1 Tax=Polyplax serrata TaxID=468196 RepID=A0ABR1AXL3_POLSC
MSPQNLNSTELISNESKLLRISMALIIEKAVGWCPTDNRTFCAAFSIAWQVARCRRILGYLGDSTKDSHPCDNKTAQFPYKCKAVSKKQSPEYRCVQGAGAFNSIGRQKLWTRDGGNVSDRTFVCPGDEELDLVTSGFPQLSTFPFPPSIVRQAL